MSHKISLPRGVHRVKSRGRIYFYYQTGRGTAEAGPRIRLPDDPRTPEFWATIRRLEGIPERTDTIGALIDAYIAAWPGLRRKIAPSTQAHYRRYLAFVKEVWGDLPAADLKPADVEALIVKIGTEKPGRANNVLSSLRSMCSWARGPAGHLVTDPTHGVKTYQSNGGHKPWTPEQLAFAEANFTGMLRRAYFLARYAGQRASDIIRLGWTDVDGDTLTLRQQKTGVRPVCPIFPELAAEMATWERRPGPFLLHESGQNAGMPIDTKRLWKVFDSMRDDHAVMHDAVWHGLRANAVISLRQLGYTGQRISDAIGMSVEMVERYSRHQDRKAGAQAVLREYRERKL
ncbi:integrase [Paracoccus sp. (in: a-proteobacteria)]|uniref:tyrosine-type recombinase/integrase n=1 Tax=Paracoccus sp. TaxID=267 RepID=UPI0028A6CD6D|nr:integrase [Paracoccus sp. (in: a-proteobacteria)]